MVIEKYTFLQIAMVFAAASWVATAAKWKFLKYITKPAMLIALMAFIWNLRPGVIFRENVNWLLLAIFFSLIGSILLLAFRNSLTPGLIAFSMVLISYIYTLHITLPVINLANAIIIVMVSLTSHQIYRRISQGPGYPREIHIKVLIPVYMLILSMMVIFSLLTLVSSGWENYRALLLSAGALLFLISNIWYAWDRFVGALKWGQLRVMISFHLGQCLLCLGFLITF
jgi:hypothetical protein